MTIEELNKIEAAAWDALKAVEALCDQARSIWVASAVALGDAVGAQNAANENKAAAANPMLAIVDEE